jgi:hypothetical protein
MAKTFQVVFGGEPRSIRFASADMKALQKRFGFESPGEWLIHRVLGLDMQTWSLKSFNLEAQHALLAVGFSRGGKPTTESLVESLWDKTMENGGSVKEAIWAAVCAAFGSGAVLGEVIDWEKESPDIKRLFFARTAADAVKAMAEPKPEEESTTPASTTTTDPESPSGSPPAVVASDSM